MSKETSKYQKETLKRNGPIWIDALAFLRNDSCVKRDQLKRLSYPDWCVVISEVPQTYQKRCQNFKKRPIKDMASSGLMCRHICGMSIMSKETYERDCLIRIGVSAYLRYYNHIERDVKMSKRDLSKRPMKETIPSRLARQHT